MINTEIEITITFDLTISDLDKRKIFNKKYQGKDYISVYRQAVQDCVNMKYIYESAEKQLIQDIEKIVTKQEVKTELEKL